MSTTQIDATDAASAGIITPKGWISVKLREVVSPSGEKIEPSEANGAAYLSLEHVESHTTRIIGRGTASDVNSTKAVFRAGDVLYGKLRPYLNKVCIPEFDGICSTDFMVFKKSPGIEPRYLMRFLNRQDVVEFTNHRMTGVQLPRISFNDLGDLELPLPPLAEQVRIVERLDELSARVDAARERLAKVPAILKRLRQAILAAACSGRLTEDWREESPEVEPATALLARVRGTTPHPVARRLSSGRSRIERPFWADWLAEAVEGPFELPKTWTWIGATPLGPTCPGRARVGSTRSRAG
jgi:type I restriction enzyme S subunit